LNIRLENKPWFKSYKLGPFKMERSLEPYPELPLYDILDQSAAKHPHATAIDYCGVRIKYRDLKVAADSLACALSGLGVRKGIRLLLFSLPARSTSSATLPSSKQAPSMFPAASCTKIANLSMKSASRAQKL
jgi:hypothetical protein